MVMVVSARTLVEKLESQLPPLVEAPPVVGAAAEGPNHSTIRSIETLVVVLAVITIAAVIAGLIARLCGGQHFGGSGDQEGWVERNCRSCIDGGVPAAPPPPPPPPPEEPPKPVTEDAKK